MVCTADDLLGWKDFPKGLRVLLVDEDQDSATEIRSKLERMDYIVSRFCNENEARLAVSSKLENFHVAIVEVNSSNSNGIFKFLETSKELPTIMTSKVHCLNTIMKCIALGAIEFLQKPLSEEKLRNIWQHVVHKAFNDKESVTSKLLEPINESVASVLQDQLDNGELKNHILVDVEELLVSESSHEHSAGIDKYPAPSTPQLKQVCRLPPQGYCADQTNCSSEKECEDQEGECKFVETTYGNLVAEATVQNNVQGASEGSAIKEESDCADGPKTDKDVSLDQEKEVNKNPVGCDVVENSAQNSSHRSPRRTKGSRKTMKVDWTPQLHKKFVQVVEQLGVDQAKPSRILELMKVEGLTRHNIASHLQKYRMHQKHILPKQGDGRWPPPGDRMQSVSYHQKPVVTYSPYYSSHIFPANQVYPVWGQPSGHPSGFQVWGQPGFPVWQPSETWHWSPYSRLHADTWGCPMVPSPFATTSSYQQNTFGFQNGVGFGNSCVMPRSCIDLHPADDIVDSVVREALSKPWLPLPIGLKPPSTGTVLAELSRQGITTVPPRITTSGSSNPR